MRKGHSGWFVEVPKELKLEFEQCYSGRAAKRRLTIAAIKRAIEIRKEQILKEELMPEKEAPQHCGKPMLGDAKGLEKYWLCLQCQKLVLKEAASR